MPYFVVDPNGSTYGPADNALLQQWVQEGRILPHTILRDTMTGQQMPASSVQGLFGPTVSSSPYSTAPPPPNYAAYPRQSPGMYDPSSQQDVTQAWIGAALGIACCAPFAIWGVVAGNRAVAKGNPGGRAPVIVSWVAIGLWAVMLVARTALGGW